MRPAQTRAIARLIAAGLAVLPAAAHAQHRTRPHQQASTPAQRPSGPPHAWLFGTWTGGLFPVLANGMAQDCRVNRTVVFAQDSVAYASLTGTGLTQRVIETVRTGPQGAEFRLTPQPGAPGLGCASADQLTVVRGGPDSITFPGCTEYPYPLQRCPTG